MSLYRHSGLLHKRCSYVRHWPFFRVFGLFLICVEQDRMVCIRSRVAAVNAMETSKDVAALLSSRNSQDHGKLSQWLLVVAARNGVTHIARSNTIHLRP
jgi:hypothetical protein